MFHLAAQPLVTAGLADPVGTLQTNILGVVNLLDAARRLPSLKAVVVVTSDKCYLRPERRCAEGDQLAVTTPTAPARPAPRSSQRPSAHCYFPPEAGVGVATARAGNVIGGGDFSPGRLLPDLVRAFTAASPRTCAIPAAIRPWQHVLDALAGYLLLAERLAANPSSFGTAWNFGPEEGGNGPRRASPKSRRNASAAAPGG